MTSDSTLLGRLRVLALFSALTLLAPVDPVLAASTEYNGRTPPRLSLLEGQVTYWHTGASEWEEAQVNLPLTPGDYVATAVDGRAEIQIGPSAFVRLASDTQLGLESQEGSLVRLDMARGRAALDLRDLKKGSRVEVQTPQGKLTTTQPGLYDVTVNADRASFVARQGGHAKVFTRYDAVDLPANSEVVSGDGVGGIATYAAAPADEWVRWNSERTDRILSANSRGNVSEEIYGVSDLDNYGTWREEPEYGRVWAPSNVGPTWAPYTTGSWAWGGDYGWSWVDTAPWGWAPYHYGRWVWCNSYWGWAPGPVYAAPVYSPALVAFFGGPSLSVGIGIGAPFVSWVALGWGEPIYPWWGPTWFRGRPCWNGWNGWGGGNVYVNNNYYYNNHGGHGPGHGPGGPGGPGNPGGPHGPGGPGHYHNQDVPNAVVGARRDDFARRTTERMRINANDQRQLRPINNGSPVDPSEVGVKPARERTRPTRPSGVEVARAQPPSQYGAVQQHGRDSMNMPGSRAGQPAATGASDVARPDRAARPLPPRDSSRQASLQPQHNDSRLGSDSGVHDVPRAPAPRDSFNDTRQRVTRDSFNDNRQPGARDSFGGTRPVPPQRPLHDKPSAPVRDSYSAPTYNNFDSVPRQRQAPRAEMPGGVERPRQPSVDMPRVERPSAPSVDMPSTAYNSAPSAPQQRSDFGNGPRYQGSPSMGMPSRPQMNAGGGGGGGSSFGSSGGGSSGGMPSRAPRAITMPGSSGSSHGHHGR